MKLYIFDFDGTLADTTTLIVQTMMDTFDAVGIHRPSVAACVDTIGLPLAECFVVSAHLSAAEGEHCADVYRKIFHQNKQSGTLKAYPGVIDTLRLLHQQGKTLAVATSRRHESLDDMLADLGVTELFSAIVAADDVAHAKPNPEPVNKILQALDCRPEDAIVIGDAPYDILMGCNAGAKTCAVSYGNGKVEELKVAGADYVIDRFPDLLRVESVQ